MPVTKRNNVRPRPTIGVLAGWQFYWTATPLSYLDPIFRGIRQAARTLDCNLLLACGMGPSADSGDPLRPAWPELSPETDFVPIGPWNTDGLVAVNPLNSPVRSRYLHELAAGGHPLAYIASGEQGPAIVADNAGGIHAAMQHLADQGHRRIAFIAGSPDDLAGDSGARLLAYRTALRVFHLADDPGLVAYGRHTMAGGTPPCSRSSPQVCRSLLCVPATTSRPLAPCEPCAKRDAVSPTMWP